MSNELNFGVFGPGTSVATQNKANPWALEARDWGLRIGDWRRQWCEGPERQTQNKANSPDGAGKSEILSSKPETNGKNH